MNGFTLLELLNATVISSIIFSFVLLVTITGFRTLADDYASLKQINTRSNRLQQEAKNIIIDGTAPKNVSINQIEPALIKTYIPEGDSYEKIWRLR